MSYSTAPALEVLTDSAEPRAGDAAVLLAAANVARLRMNASPVDAVATANDRLSAGWTGVLAAAQLVSAWELSNLPKLRDVPDALWAAYMEWLLAHPAEPDSEHLDALATHLTRCTDDLADWMVRNLAAVPVRAAADVYSRSPRLCVERFPRSLQLPLQKARVRILERSLTHVTPAKPAASPRNGRALRVGILHSRLDHRAETFATLARCSHLDAACIELKFFTLEPTYTVLEDRCRELSGDLQFLSGNFSTQLATLREARLDVLIFADDLVAHTYPFAQLAILRAAPLQISTSPVSSGLGSIDIVLGGVLDEAATSPHSFIERLALLPGTAHTFDCSVVAEDVNTAPATRESFCLPNEAPILLVTEQTKPTAADLHAVKSALIAHPELHVVVLDDRADPYASTSTWFAALENSPEAPGRVQTIVPLSADLTEQRSIISLVSVLYSPSALLASIALESGIPVLGTSTSACSGLLRTASLNTWIAPSPTALAAELASVIRNPLEARTTLATALEQAPRFLSPFLVSHDFGALLETIWDDLIANGIKSFRRNKAPITITPERLLAPADLPALGRQLLADDVPTRAVHCLLAAIQSDSTNATLWFDLARAYLAAGSAENALPTLEASLRLDDQNAAGWVMLAELAAGVGALDLAREALECAAKIDPQRPELPSLRNRLAI